MDEIDTTNRHFVGVNGIGDITIIGDVRHNTFTRESALNLAAWIVTLADPLGDDFNALLDAIKQT